MAHPHEIDFQALRKHTSYSLLVDGKSFETNIYNDNGDWEICLRGRRFHIRVEDERERRLRMAAGQTSQTGRKIHALVSHAGFSH